MKITSNLRDAIETYKSGDESAFTTIYEESKGYVYSCISNTLSSENRNEDLIQDIMQDTYLEVSKELGKLESTDRFLAWTATIAKRKTYATLKKNGKYVLLTEDETFENLADADNTIPEDIVISKEKQEKVREVINNELTEDEKDCVISYYYNDMKQKDIAEKLEMPQNTVASNIFRAKSKMRQALEGILVLAVVASIALLLVNSQIIKEATKVKNKKEEPSTVTQENTTEAATEEETEGIIDEVVDETAVPGGIIPTGCTYYVAATDKTLGAGEKFPDTIGEWDKYVTKDYKYEYIQMIDYESLTWEVTVRDKTKISYGKILSSVMGEPIIILPGTFSDCINLVEAPKIPDNVEELYLTFQNCTSLVKTPEIPSGVTSMVSTFDGCTSLVEVTEIPAGVASMYHTFSGCTSLVKAPEIPEGLSSLESTFSGCTNLVEAPKILNAVDMSYAFSNCTNLVKAPEITGGRFMEGTFEGCTSLTGDIVINANPESYGICFKDVDFTKQNITVTGSSYLLPELMRTGIFEYIIPEGCTYYIASTGETLKEGDIFPNSPEYDDIYSTMDYDYKGEYENDHDGMGWAVVVKDKTKEKYEELLTGLLGVDVQNMNETFSGCTNLKEAPKIPSTVNYMYHTFEGCTSLVEAPEIPRSVYLMAYTFSGCTSLEKVSVIHEDVVFMQGTFEDCTSLTGNIVINANPSRYIKCFSGVDLTSQNITLSGTSTILENIKKTEGENTPNENVVEYGDSVRVSVMYKRDCEIKENRFDWKAGEETEFVVDIEADEFDYCTYTGKYDDETWEQVEQAMGKTVGDKFVVSNMDTCCIYTYEYTILEIKKRE